MLQRYLGVCCLCVVAIFMSSCATMFKSNMNSDLGSHQAVDVRGVPPQGLVVASDEPMFVHMKDSRISKSSIFSEEDVEDVEESHKSDIAWISPRQSHFDMMWSSFGDPVVLKVYCDCALKDKGRRTHGREGGAILEPDCPGGKARPKRMTVRTEMSTLWLIVNFPLIGQAVDYLTGALYDYKPFHVCKKSGKS